jgi:thiamine-monophosphate kinase
MLENTGRSEAVDFGKESLIKYLGEFFKLNNSSSITGIENDASVLSFENQLVLTASQIFVEHIHFDLGYFPLKHLGFKIVSAAASDIIGMNGIPSQIRINIAASNRFSVEALEEFISGVKYCCERFNIDLIGLDVTTSAVGLTIATTIIGTVTSEKLVKRSGAGEDEIICVSGDLGAAYTGLLLLEREKRVFEVDPNQQPDLSGYEYILERELKPEPRIDIIQELAELEVVPTSMMNVKDGLANALLHICSNSNVGCTIYEEKLPIDTITFETLKELKIVATTIALNGGEDYEVIFTIKQDDYEKIKNSKNISVIGYITAETAGKNLITNDNCLIELKAQGFQSGTQQI